jgi:neutral ceramidase
MVRTLFFLYPCLVLFSSMPPVRAAELRAGVAVVDITPPVPWRMSGYFTERVSTGAKDPLHAKAVVFEQGDTTAALVFCDLIGIPLDVSVRARQHASRATGIPVENIAITATHTHTGPLFFGSLRDHFHQRSIKRLGSDPNETLNYSDQLVKKLVGAIEEAKSKLQPVQIAAGYAEENRLSFNRRFHMRDGSVRFNPGQLNPDIRRPAGPIDPQVGLISLKSPGADNPFAAIVAFALHLDTTGGTEYSADYPKFMQDRLRESCGKDFVAQFGAGTCGDINHIDVKTKEVRKPEEIGRLLAETVEKALKSNALTPIAEPALAVRSAKVDAPLQHYSPSEMAAAREKLDDVGTRKLSFLEEVEVSKIAALQSYDGPTWPLEVQAFRLSRDAAVVTLPTEIFVELGLAIKAASPFKTTIIIELANDSLGYIPTKKAFAEGSYEIVNSRVQPGAGELLVETAIRLLKELE